MRRAFKNADAAADFVDALGKQRQNRRALFHARRKLMGVTSKADGFLTGNQQLDESGVISRTAVRVKKVNKPKNIVAVLEMIRETP